jgi:hypothetical protein
LKSAPTADDPSNTQNPKPKTQNSKPNTQHPPSWNTFRMDDYTADGANDLTEFYAEDELDLLRSNVLALAAGTIAFLREQGVPVTGWTAKLGELFARGWDTDEPWSPEDFLDATIVNLTAFGGEAVQAEFGEDDANAVVARFPDMERIAGLGLEEIDADILYDLIEPIALACGLHYDWQREGDTVRITVRAGQ